VKSFVREPFDALADEERNQTQPCFICAMITGETVDTHLTERGEKQ